MLLEDVMAFLTKRQGQLQGVVVTGGEPTLHHDLKDFLRRIKSLGFLVKLDTNGSNPDVLGEILREKLVDLVAMDIKSSLEGYCKATGVIADLEAVKASIALIQGSGVAHIFRTTVLKRIVSDDDIRQIRSLLGETKSYKLQRGNLSGNVLNRDILDGPGEYSDAEWEQLTTIIT
jgi:pyruvate formate lyase activating enzyme